MNRPHPMGGAARFLVMGWLALAGCGRQEASSGATHARSVSAALESGTDLVVTEVKAPANVRNGQGFTASVTVCNQGSVPSSYNWPRLELFLSTDAALTLPDPANPSPPPEDQVSIGSVDLEPLAPEQCVTKSVPAYAWLPPAAQGDGAYYLAAAVDTMNTEQESREDNNVLVSGLMGVGSRADLVVSEVSGPASVWPGQGVLATVKVCNQGTSSTSGGYYPYGSSRVELFLSMDTALTLPDPSNPSPAIPTDQISIGYVELDSLYEGQCVTKSVPVQASLPPDAMGDGAFYLAAAVDTNNAEQELREDNNVRVGALMGVGDKPDLVVTEVKAPASVRPGDGFSATVKVCNQGTSPVQGSPYSGPQVELFVVTDAAAPIPAGAVPLGSVVLDQELYPAQCVTKSMWAHANPPMDAPAPEDGAYPLVAVVDRAGGVQELREDNNVRVSGLLGLGYRSDLVVTGVKAPASLWNGQGFMANVTVCNQGTSTSNAYSWPRVELFLSTRPEVTLPSPSMPYPGTPSSQMSIGYVELEGLYAGQCVTKSVQANASLPPDAQGDGAYYLAAAVDTMNTEQELREDNNVRVEGLVGVGYRSDLVVSEVKAPASVGGNGQGFTASVTVCNQGTAPGGGGSYPYYSRPRVELFLSMDAELTLLDPSQPSGGMPPDQTSIGQVDLDQNLSPGQCVTKNVNANAWVPPAAMGMDGAYYLAAAVDTNNAEQELREDNNVRVSGLMGVGYRADFVVTEVSGPTSLTVGQGFTATVKVCNQGAGAPSNSYVGERVELFLSMDDELTMPGPSMPYPGGMPADQLSIGQVELTRLLGPGECETTSVPAVAGLPPAAMGMEGAYYLAAAVDTTNLEQELREDNNVRVGELTGVGYRSDLVVSELSAPVSVGEGQSFTANVKVCNQGTTPTNGWPQVALYLSPTASFSLPEQSMPYPGSVDPTPIGTVDLNQTLNPSQCVTKSVSAQASVPSGPQSNLTAYYLVAAVDTNRVEQELREDNNVRVGELMGVGNHPDLVVTEVRGPASVGNGQGFTASVTVCNQGTLATASDYYYSWPRVDLFLSMDAELKLQDPSIPYWDPPGDQMPIGWVEVEQVLQPGQCVTKDVSANASLPPDAMGQDGAYYLAAAVDTTWAEQELREDNNVRVGGLMGVGYRSDLVVSELSAPASVGNGASFTANVKVCNQGTAPTNSSAYSRPRVDLFLSMDTELTLQDPLNPYPPNPARDQTPIGWVELDQPLSPGQCVTKSVNAYASVPPDAMGMDGVYYLAAAVDTTWVEQELREDNNVRVGGLMGVGYRSDLVVAEVSGPASVNTSESFTASVKVCNQGAAPTSSYSSQPNVELFLTMDAAFSMPAPGAPPPEPSSFVSIGSVELTQPLAPGECVRKSVKAQASLPSMAQDAGAFYLAAAVDTHQVEPELREDNNVRVGGPMGVGYGADLVVAEVSAPASVNSGESFTANVKVCNQGTAPTNGYTQYSGPQVELYLSASDAFVMPSQGMPYPPSQDVIGLAELDQPLLPGQCVTRSVSAAAWPPPGTPGDGAYHLAAAVDTHWLVQELREDNNLRVGGLLGVGYRPDLVVSELTAPASVGNGQQLTATVKVCNQGTVPTGSGSSSWPRLELYLSPTTGLTLPTPGYPNPVDQTFIGSVEIDQQLYPGRCVARSVTGPAWLPPSATSDGAYYLVAAVDTTQVEQELREDNNLLASGLVGVGSRADLVVSELSAPASASDNQPFTASVKVCNQGTVSTGSAPQVALFLSMDTELTLPSPGQPYPPPSASDQTLIAQVELPQALSPGQCVTKSVDANAWLPPEAPVNSALYLAAVVDPSGMEPELREDNNAHVGGLLGVGSLADLVVKEVSAPADVDEGQPFTASVKVCNQGTAPTSSSYYPRPLVELFLSVDAEVTPPSPGQPYPPPGMPVEQVSIGYAELGQPLSPGQCVTQSVNATAWPPPSPTGQRAYYLAAIADTKWMELELREDNNVRVSGLMGVGQGADLVVSEVTGPASVSSGQPLTASVKVCNQGTGPTSNPSGGARVELYLSRDTELTLPDPGSPPPSPDPMMEQVLVGWVELDQPLAPSQCVTKSVSGGVNLPPGPQGEGTFYLAAAVDTLGMEQELREDNNIHVGAQVGVGNRADLVVSEVTGPASASGNQPFTASVTVCNQGTTPTLSSGARVELFLSMDTELTLPSPGQPYPPEGDQVSLGSVDLDQPLFPSQCVTKSMSAWAKPPPLAQGEGAFYLVAAVDTMNAEQELREDNNVRVGGLMGVGDRSDLVVSEVTAPASVGMGQQFTATVKVCNQGTVPTSSPYGKPRVELYLSLDDEVTMPSPGMPYPAPTHQTLIGYVELEQPLSPSQCVTKSLTADAWPPPTQQPVDAFYLAAAVDTTWMEQELREDNNLRVGTLLQITP